MNKPMKQLSTALMFIFLLSGGGLYPAMAADDDGYFPVRIENPEGLRLFFVQSQVRDGELVVTGKVRKSRLLRGHAASEIHVTLEGFDGQVLAEKTISYTPKALSSRRAHDEARFTASFSDFPKDGAVVRVSGPEKR